MSETATNLLSYLDQWIGPGMTALVKKALPLAAAALSKQLAARLTSIPAAQYQAINKTLLASVIASPFGSSLFNIHPLSAFAGIAATTIGQIYLLVREIFSSFCQLSLIIFHFV